MLGASMISWLEQSFHKNPKLLKAAVYGANDGIITTFAVVAGVAGAGLSSNIVVILGIANMIADGLSMGLGDYLGERSERKLRRRQKTKTEDDDVWKTGLTTFIAFVVAGSFPLLPYFVVSFGWGNISEFSWSIAMTGLILFSVGSARSFMTKSHWLREGAEMLSVGAIAAVVAFILGAGVERLIR